MGTTEWILLVLVIAIPLVIAVVVTLWTLEQARLRSRQHRRPGPRRPNVSGQGDGVEE